MTKRVGFMFAGQGAQTVGMGKDLYETSPAAREIFDRADEILGRSISGICFDGPEDALTASANCQPAIFTMSMACAVVLKERTGVQPVVCGGLSLGEFAGLTVAGVIDFETGLKLVNRRGALMDEACAATDGAMAAVIGADLELIEKTCAEHGVDVANLNCPGQVVISGERGAVEKTMSALGDAGVSRIIFLQVAGAFHSRLMTPAATAFSDVLDETSFAPPSCSVVQNVTGGIVTDPAEIRENLRAQVTGSVRWEDCVRSMIADGADVLVELGPGKVLSGFMRRIERRFPIANVGGTADLDAAATALV